MKICIVTFQNAYNYGAFLQAYALQKKLLDCKHEVRLLNYNNSDFNEAYRYKYKFTKQRNLRARLKFIRDFILKPWYFVNNNKKIKKFESAIQNEFYLTELYDVVEQNISDAFDCFISGSDQVWNLNITKEHCPVYLLDFVEDSNKKISYAASFGAANFKKAQYDILKKSLSSFRNILVRESTGKKLLQQNCAINSEVVLDPTLLLTKDEWQGFVSNGNFVKPCSKFVLVYLMTKPVQLLSAAIEYAEKHGFEVIVLGSCPEPLPKHVKLVSDAGPYDFISYFLKAEAVFTTSFHGTIFSINFNKEFYYELNSNPNNKNSRITDIIDIFELNDRAVSEASITKKPINWEKINLRLDLERKRSTDLLLQSISFSMSEEAYE